MKNIYLSIITISMISMSCSDNNEPIIKENASFPLTIKFEGVTYDIKAQYDGDTLIYLDEEFSRVFNLLIKNLENSAVMAYKAPDGHDVLEYYSTVQELEETNGIQYIGKELLMNMRSGISDPVDANIIGRAILYDDTNYSDREVVLNIDCNYWISIPNLKQSNSFNDKTSSIRVFNFLSPNSTYFPSYLNPSTAIGGGSLRTCLIGYEDSNFEGSKLYCISNTYQQINYVVDWDTAYHQDWKLGKIGWNDKISSVEFRIINISNINSGVYVAHAPIN